MNLINRKPMLHVIGGESAAGSLRAALRLDRDQLLVNEDMISCGPTPATEDLAVWRATREKFLRETFPDWPDFSFDKYADHGLLMNASRLGEDKTVVVWAALGLPDQLLLAWVVFLFDRLGLDLSRLRVVQFEESSPRQGIISMGQLSPENIQKFRPAPRPLNAEQAQELRRAWSAYTSSDPAELSRYLATASSMPVLHRAMSHLVDRYPDSRSGVGGWDEKLLHYTMENGPAAARVIGYTLGYNNKRDWVGDLYLFQRLMALGGTELASPLISVTGSRRTMRECGVGLTSFGRQVLAGEANSVHENGIDEWIGGVHLSREGGVVFREAGSLVLPH